jgi:CelD/BcsL family acetyltransferase involved in cellulose biosynthesis
MAVLLFRNIQCPQVPCGVLNTVSDLDLLCSTARGTCAASLRATSRSDPFFHVCMACLEGECALPVHSGCRVIEINDARELVHYQLAWEALLAQTPGANYFQTLDWLSVYWQHYGAGCRLRVLVVQVLGKTIGILPLVVREEATKVGRLRVLNYPLQDWGTFYGPIGPNPTATLLASFNHLQRTARDWDVLDLRWVDEQRTDRGRTARALEQSKLTAYRNQWSESAIIDLSAAGTWDNYWASRTSKWRNNVRRNERRLNELGEVKHLRYRPLGARYGDDDPRWDLYRECEGIARRSWQGESKNGTTLSHDSIRNFLQDSHAAAAKAGGVDLNLLYVNDTAVAFNYAYCLQGSLFGLRMGFDRATGAEGAGSVLLYRMLQDSFVRGDRVFDLGDEYLDCKRPWQTLTVASYRYSHYPPVVSRAQLIHAKRWVQSWLGSGV